MSNKCCNCGSKLNGWGACSDCDSDWMELNHPVKEDNDSLSKSTKRNETDNEV